MHPLRIVRGFKEQKKPWRHAFYDMTGMPFKALLSTLILTLFMKLHIRCLGRVLMTAPDRAIIATVVQNESSLRVDWAGGDSSIFHYLWLRDCCYCDACGDCYSSLRRYVPNLETIGIRPSSVTWTDDELKVDWTGDQHTSVFTADWLSANRYDDQARANRRCSLTYSDSSTNVADLSFDFQNVKNSAEGQLALQRHLITHGIVILKGGPTEPGSVTSFAELFGDVTQSAYGTVFDLTPGNAIGTAGTTLRAVPPHSDEAFVYSPPGIEVLACVRPADDGGDSIMVDGFSIAEKVRRNYPESFKLLAKWNHYYVRRNPGQRDQRAYAPIIALDDDDEISGVRLHTRASGPLDLPESEMEDYLVAYHRLCAEMMDPVNQVRVRLKAGEAVVFDNHRALHARSEFSDRARFMQICGVTREKFHEQFRLLATQLGDFQAANLVLRAGVCR